MTAIKNDGCCLRFFHEIYHLNYQAAATLKQYIAHLMDMKNKILLFDGECILCSRSIQFILKHERNNLIYFAALKSEYAKKLMSHYHVDIQYNNSIVFITDQKVFTKSKAVFSICQHLKMPFATFQYLKFIPSVLSNIIYDFIANNRYRFFDKRETCFYPPDIDKKRFIY